MGAMMKKFVILALVVLVAYMVEQGAAKKTTAAPTNTGAPAVYSSGIFGGIILSLFLTISHTLLMLMA